MKKIIDFSIIPKLWRILPPKYRLKSIILFGFLFIGMLLETLGVGMVIPALAIMTDTELGIRYPVLVPLLNKVGNPSREELVVLGMLMLVGVYSIKSFFLAFLAWWQTRFIFELQASLSQELFTGYLQQPYSFHLQRNSSQLHINTIEHVSSITAIFQQGLMLVTEFVVVLGISILLLMVEPLGALLVISVLIAAGWSFHAITRIRLLQWGAASKDHEELRIKHLQQGFGGAKDIKLLGREEEFLEQYRKHNFGSADVNRKRIALQALPRLWLELLVVIGLASLVTIMIIQNKPIEILIPTLGVFAAAAFRVMPSVSRILSAFQSIRYYLPVIETLDEELCTLKSVKQMPHDAESLIFTSELVLNNVSFSYPSTEVAALDKINFSISKGNMIGFVGGSGAGKSTLVDVILGLLTPTAGQVKIDSTDIQSNLRSWQNQIGYVPQSIYLTDDSLRRNIAFGLSDEKIDDKAVWHAINDAQLNEFIKSLPRGINTDVGERGVRLSGGQRQRIGIARALYHDPQVLVLDEATSSLDTKTEQDVMTSIRALHGNKTILIVAHRLSTVEHCDYLFRLEQGRIIDEGESCFVLKRIQNSIKTVAEDTA